MLSLVGYGAYGCILPSVVTQAKRHLNSLQHISSTKYQCSPWDRGSHERKITPAWSKPGVHWRYIDIGHWATGITSQKLLESCKAGKMFWWNLLGPPGVPTLTRWGHLLWLCATLWQNTAAQYGTTLHMSVLSKLNCIPPCALYLGPLYHGCHFSPTLNLQLYDAELLQASC